MSIPTLPRGRPRLPVGTPPWALVLVLFGVETGAAGAQQIRGVVTDASTGEPLAEVLVRTEPTGSVTLTDRRGGFALETTRTGLRALSFQRLGYVHLTVPVEGGAAAPLEVALEPAPLPVEGFEVRTESFDTRFGRVETSLDRRLARSPGVSRVVGHEALRRFDDDYADDPWSHLSALLDLEPDAHQDAVRVGWGGSPRTRPDVYIDDRPRWLFQLLETPTSSLCRIEVYRPDGEWVPNRAQIRAYTCFFLAQVADDRRKLRARLHWGDLIAGPWIG